MKKLIIGLVVAGSFAAHSDVQAAFGTRVLDASNKTAIKFNDASAAKLAAGQKTTLCSNYMAYLGKATEFWKAVASLPTEQRVQLCVLATTIANADLVAQRISAGQSTFEQEFAAYPFLFQFKDKAMEVLNLEAQLSNRNADNMGVFVTADFVGQHCTGMMRNAGNAANGLMQAAAPCDLEIR